MIKAWPIYYKSKFDKKAKIWLIKFQIFYKKKLQIIKIFGNFRLKTYLLYSILLKIFKKKNINNFISFFLLIIYAKIILKQSFSLSNLFKTQIFYKILQIIIVYKNRNLILVTFKIIVLIYKNFNNYKKFVIANLILGLSKKKKLKKKFIECYQSELLKIS